VYDATAYLNEHPGGPESVRLVAGQDATEDFMAIHSSDAKTKLAEYHIGTLSGGTITHTAEPATEDDDGGDFLHAKRWKPTSLIKVRDVSRDSKIFRFVLDRPDQSLGLPTGQHVYARLRRKAGPNVVEGEIVQRAYTPLSRPECTGYIDLLVKYVDNAFSGVNTIDLQYVALGFITPTLSIH
jgi:nitrate reductase (NAD(P)H)